MWSRTSRASCWSVALALVLGPALAETPETAPEIRAPHPEPRVIVTVTGVRGPHDRAAVQRSARETWGSIVRCYKDLGEKQRGTLDLRLEISAGGDVRGARRLNSTLNAEVSTCLLGALRKKKMPPAKSGSSATLEIKLAPGDERDG